MDVRVQQKMQEEAQKIQDKIIDIEKLKIED